jgi:hypothetical protein
MKPKYILGALVAVVVLAAVAYFYGGSQAPSGQPPLDSLTAGNLAEVKNQFNAAQDDVRLLLLLSPT